MDNEKVYHTMDNENVYQDASEPTFVLGNVFQRNRVGNHVHGMRISVLRTINVCFLTSEEDCTRLKHDIKELVATFNQALLERDNGNTEMRVSVRTHLEAAFRGFTSLWSGQLVPPMLRMTYLQAAQKYGFGTSVPIDAECILGNWGNVAARPSRRPVDNEDWIKANVLDRRIMRALAHDHAPFILTI